MGKETFVTTLNKNNDKRTASRTPDPTEPHSPGRRAFMVLAGTSAGATLLGGLAACGGSINQPASASSTPTAAQDPIWGSSGAATRSSLRCKASPSRCSRRATFWSPRTVRSPAPSSRRPIRTRARRRLRVPARSKPTAPARSIHGPRFSPR
ncbi:hypothetical protein BN2475_1160004 [Paraburkholderia ribeironis]|uniref:Uncharacterized protein n=1 Tax=Paraburkholderia ribeironis TaxID=1247936 RepID=A0A1N7SNK4_9BURK|nr:hypothetical protein BN2475_1160004 [Paraburkholderia ribeironis]